MKAILDIIKQYKWEIGFGAAGALGVVLIVLGLGGMQEVKTELDAAVRVKSEIASMARGASPINEKAIEAEERRIDTLQAGFRQVLGYVREHNLYAPLVPGAFPNANRDQRTRFQQDYRDEIPEWLELLHAGQPPTDDEIAAERDIMKSKEPNADLLGADPVDRTAERKDEQKEDALSAEVRASIRNARQSYCYASPYAFQVSAVSDLDGPMWKGPPPEMKDMWEAQLELWVQRTVVQAIADVNEAAAARLPAGEDPWVGNLPIKDLLSLQTTRYYIKEGVPVATEGADRDRAYPPTAATGTFTQRQSNELFELMRFSVQLVVDARALPEVIGGLSRGRFHVPLNVQYETVPPNLDFVGKIYGDDPVVQLTIDFDTVFFSELYLPLMPDSYLELLGKRRPEPDQTAGV